MLSWCLQAEFISSNCNSTPAMPRWTPSSARARGGHKTKAQTLCPQYPQPGKHGSASRPVLGLGGGAAHTSREARGRARGAGAKVRGRRRGRRRRRGVTAFRAPIKSPGAAQPSRSPSQRLDQRQHRRGTQRNSSRRAWGRPWGQRWRRGSVWGSCSWRSSYPRRWAPPRETGARPRWDPPGAGEGRGAPPGKPARREAAISPSGAPASALGPVRVGRGRWVPWGEVGSRPFVCGILEGAAARALRLRAVPRGGGALIPRWKEEG